MSADHEYKPRRVDALAQALVAGDLVYVQPCDAQAPPAKRYDAQRGEAPGFADLQAKLHARGLKLERCAPYYFAAVRL